MRRLVFAVTLLACMTAFPQKATDGEAQAEPTLSVPTTAAFDPVVDKGNGLYAFQGIATRHGPQCVEYAERFYATLYPGTFPVHNSGPGAYDIWEGVANRQDIGGWPTHRQFFVAYANGTTDPKPNDMLLYDRTRGGGYGHVAVIAAVYPQAVEILEQNNGWDTLRLLPRIGNEIIDRGVKGVIRLRSGAVPS